ncbi:AhpD-like protein [Coniella lustricola]|uniref:AhpD-like protein n=1 Tax=Coniella lustricola TaxID=2025994 RepID=A0A2T3ALM3_9PEZI|nr:AhpD-like protein [Coniella lustricola]
MTILRETEQPRAPIFSPTHLDSLRSRSDVPNDTWYLVVATALCILNRPEDIQTVYTHAVGAGHAPVGVPNGVALPDKEQQRIARRIREALLKVSAIGGLPKTINALQELKKVVPAHLSDEPEAETTTAPILARGRAFFDKCYGKVAQRVMSSLDHCGTEDLGLAVRLTYGYVLSPTTILSEAETSFVMIAGLIPQDVNPQLKGHLKGALNGGAGVAQVRAVRQVAIDVCEAAGMKVLSSKDGAAGGGWGWRSPVQDL